MLAGIFAFPLCKKALARLFVLEHQFIQDASNVKGGLVILWSPMTLRMASSPDLIQS